MELKTKAKKYFAEKYNETSILILPLALSSVFGTAYMVGMGVYEEVEEKAPAAITQAQAAEEERIFQNGLGEVVTLAKKVHSYEEYATRFERDITKGLTVDASKQALFDLRLSQAKDKIVLDQKSRDLAGYALVTSNIPEARYDRLLEEFRDGKKTYGLTTVLDKVYQATNYRDECRVELGKKDTSNMSDREKTEFVSACSTRELSDNSSLSAISALGSVFGTMVGFFTLLGAGGRVQYRWRREAEYREYEKKRAEERALRALENAVQEKENPPPPPVVEKESVVKAAPRLRL